MTGTSRRTIIARSAFVAGALALFLLWRESTIVREGEPLELHATGRVFDYATGLPIPDAWVLLGLHTSHTSLGGYGGGCYYGSTVVRTDANGEFSYRATIRKAGNGRSGFWTVVYHPEYAGELTWGPPTVPGVSTFPIDHPTDGAPLSIGMARREIDEWEALREIYKYSQQVCLDFPMDKGQADFSRMRYERTLALHCDPTPGNGPFPPRDVMGYLEARLYEQVEYAHPNATSELWVESQIFRGSYVTTQLLPAYPWEASHAGGYPPRDLTAAEKTAFCSFYSLPIENLINREFLP